MEFNNHRIIRDFISDNEVKSIIDWFNKITHVQKADNHHIIELGKKLNGNSHMFNISKNELTDYVTNFQSGNDVLNTELPVVINNLIDRISLFVGLPKENVFLQAVDMHNGGTIRPHYDISVEGYINYKCNISVFAEDYNFNIDKEVISIKQKDMYCFEASLYKHWTEKEFTSRRVLLSFGFLVPYSLMNRSGNDPRVRLSRRINKYFQ
jgi:ferredoxin-fold anticodon binding domain-containing protein